MATDDMKPEEKRILLAMFDDGKKMSIERIMELLNLPSQETLYYVEKLQAKELISFQPPSIFVSSGLRSGGNETVYYLNDKGRAYVMEELKPNKAP